MAILIVAVFSSRLSRYRPVFPPYCLRARRCDVRLSRRRRSSTRAKRDRCLLAFGLAEAKALIEQHRAAVLAIVEAVMIERNLNQSRSTPSSPTHRNARGVGQGAGQRSREAGRKAEVRPILIEA
jgi:hypothetical protein